VAEALDSLVVIAFIVAIAAGAAWWRTR
jgi:hypothetical protein